MKFLLLPLVGLLLVSLGQTHAVEEPMLGPFNWEGLVLSADGKPAADAEVFVCRVSGRDCIVDTPILANGRTDAAGKYRFSYSVPVRIPVYPIAVVAFTKTGMTAIGSEEHFVGEPSRGPEKLVLEPTTEFKARVLGPDGSPVAGLKVWVAGYFLDRKGPYGIPISGAMPKLPDGRWSAMTDNEGRCAISGLPKEASVYLMHGDKRYAQPSGMHAFSGSEQAEADGSEKVVRLTRPGSIRGSVLLPDGTPAAGTVVSILERMPYITAYGSEVRADKEGRFTLDQIPASTYKLHYETVPPLADEWIGSDKNSVVVVADKVTDVGDLVVSHPAFVTGEVVNAETGAVIEKPIEWQLEAGRQELWYRSMRTPPAGFYPPESQETISVTLKPGERKTVQFRLRPVKAEDLVTGVVLGADGKPVPGAKVELLSEDMHGDAPVEVGADGQFQFILPPDVKVVSVVAWQGSEWLSNLVPAKRGDRVQVKLQKDGFAKVFGQVTDEAGKPVKGATVRCWMMGLDIESTDIPVTTTIVTRDDGKFLFPRLWTNTGEVYFFCTHKSYGANAERDINLSATKPLELKFVAKKADPSITVAGVVVDTAGKPVSGAHIYYSGDGQPQGNRNLVTDAEGKFEIAPLATGSVFIRVSEKADTFSRDASQRVKAPNREVRIVMPDADGMVTGTVVDAAGKPVADAKVDSFERGRATRTDGQGHFALTGIVKGWFSIDFSYRSPEGREIKHRQRLKSGMKEVRVEMPAKTIAEKERRPLPLDLIGKPAPDIQVANWINTAALPAKAGGKVRILDFWGIQCAPCIAGLPHVRDFWTKHKGDNLEIIALTGYATEEVSEFLAKHADYRFPFAIMAEEAVTFYDYDVRGIPTYFVIDPTGKVVSSGHDWGDAAAMAEKLLAERQP